MVEPVLCVVGCLKTSLALTHFMPVGPPNLWQPEVSPDLLSIFLETKPPPAENPNSNPVNYKLLRKTHIAEKI